MTAKATHPTFPLSTVAGRVALLTSVISGIVPNRVLENIVVHDTEKRPYRKPVVVPINGKEKRFPSVREAAHAKLVEQRCGGTYGPMYLRMLNAMEKRIANYCNADNVKGYYWSE